MLIVGRTQGGPLLQLEPLLQCRSHSSRPMGANETRQSITTWRLSGSNSITRACDCLQAFAVVTLRNYSIGFRANKDDPDNNGRARQRCQKIVTINIGYD
jgi:hypothetical protein